jgi:flagellar hook protein FlgE
MIGAISSALSGIMSASKKADMAAANVANGTTPGYEVDLAEEAVNLKLAEITFKANVNVIKVAEDMAEETGRLLDVKA